MKSRRQKDLETVRDRVPGNRVCWIHWLVEMSLEAQWNTMEQPQGRERKEKERWTGQSQSDFMIDDGFNIQRGLLTSFWCSGIINVVARILESATVAIRTGEHQRRVLLSSTHCLDHNICPWTTRRM